MPKAKPSAQPSTPPNTMTGLAGWVEGLPAGTHTDSKGREITLSTADLDQMVDNHKLGPIPAVIGHPKQNAPAYAWTSALKREGDMLFAKFTDINPDFEAGVKSKAYRNRSLSVFKDKKHGWRVRHVGWLGAQPPAIDGLAPVEFAADEVEVYEFAAPGYSLVWGMESIVRLLRGLRDQLIAKDGIEAADAVLPQWQIDSAMESVNQARTQFQEADDTGRLFSQSDNPGGSMSFTQEQLDAARAEARTEAEALLRTEFASKEETLRVLTAERQAERIAAQIAGWKGEAKVLPAEEPGLAEFMASLEDAEGEFSFSASDGTEAKKSPAVFFAEFMAGRAPLVKLGLRTAHETPPSPEDASDFSKQPGYSGVTVDADRAALDGRIKAYMKEHSVDYRTAAARVIG